MQIFFPPSGSGEPNHWHYSDEPVQTIWARIMSADEGATLPCAACGTSDHVMNDPRCGELPFCQDCTEHTRNLNDWDDIGVGD
ncbi:MAG: hypothetical protein AAGF11_26560 [Myxococcota bacterium]